MAIHCTKQPILCNILRLQTRNCTKYGKMCNIYFFLIWNAYAHIHTRTRKRMIQIYLNEND